MDRVWVSLKTWSRHEGLTSHLKLYQLFKISNFFLFNLTKLNQISLFTGLKAIKVFESTLVSIMENRQRNIAALLSDSNCSKRRCQKSVNLGFFEQIAPNMTNQEFWSHFRISRWIFDYLIINLKDKLKRQDTIFKKAINHLKRIYRKTNLGRFKGIMVI